MKILVLRHIEQNKHCTLNEFKPVLNGLVNIIEKPIKDYPFSELIDQSYHSDSRRMESL